jgi:hypothetical protein
MANYEDLKYSGVTDSTILNTAITTAVSTAPGASSKSFTVSSNGSAGDVVQLASSGTVDVVGITLVPGEFPGTVTESYSDMSASDASSVAWDPDQDDMFLSVTINNYKTYIYAWRHNADGSLTWVASSEIYSSYSSTQVEFVPNSPGRFIIVCNTNSTVFAQSGTLNGSTIVMHNDQTQISSVARRYSQAIEFAFDPAQTGVAVVIYSTNIGQHVITSISMDVNGIITPSSESTALVNTYSFANIAFNPAADGTFIFHTVSTEETIYGSVSGNTVVISANTGLWDSQILPSPMAWDSSNANRYISIEGEYVKYWSTDGSSKIWITSTRMLEAGWNPITPLSAAHVYIRESVIPGKFLIFMRTDDREAFIFEADVTSGAIVLGTLTKIEENTTSSINTGNAMAIHPISNKFAVSYAPNQQDLTFLVGTLDLQTTRYDADKIVGILNSNVVAGSSATVLMDGAIFNGFVGLTPGSMYYVNANGLSDISTSGNTQIGKSISSTELHIIL